MFSHPCNKPNPTQTNTTKPNQTQPNTTWVYLVQATPVNQDETPLYNMVEPSQSIQEFFFLQMRIENFFFFWNIVGVKALPFSRAGAHAH